MYALADCGGPGETCCGLNNFIAVGTCDAGLFCDGPSDVCITEPGARLLISFLPAMQRSQHSECTLRLPRLSAVHRVATPGQLAELLRI